MIKRLAAALGVIVFLVAAGTSISYAYWAATAEMTTSVTTANPVATNCSNIVKLANGSFEDPALPTNNDWSQTISQTSWTSRAPGTATARAFEVWRGSVVSPILPVSGSQNIELNSDNPATVYQQVSTTSGQVLRWSFWHRGRDSATTPDKVQLTVGAPTTNAAAVSTATTSNTTPTTISTGATLVMVFPTTNTAWTYYSGSYTVPSGQTTTRLSLTSFGAGGGNASQGNLIDDVSLGTGPCVSPPTSSISNVTTGGTTYRVGDRVRYTTTISNGGGASAASSIAKIVLPANLTLVDGTITVNGTASTNVSGDDLGDYLTGSRTVVARIGGGATATAGGKLTTGVPVTVTYDAIIGTAAAGGTITHTPVVEFVDESIPTWTLSSPGATLTTAVAGAADLQIAVLSSPGMVAGSATWRFRVTNNGPQDATGAAASVTLPSGVTFTAGSLQQTTTDGGTTTTSTGCTTTGTTRTCTIGVLPAGQGRTIALTGTMPSNPTAYASTGTVSSTSFDPDATNNTVVNTASDTQAPTAPGSPTATRVNSGQVYVTWTTSTDNVGVTGYRVYRNSANNEVLVATTNQNTYNVTDTGVAANTAYWYTIVAIDAAGNVSPRSNGAGAVTWKDSTTYRIVYVNSAPDRCVGGASSNDSAALQVQDCSTTSLNQRFTFSWASSNSAQIGPATSTDRRWSTNGSTGNNAPIVLENTAWYFNQDRLRWDVGVAWDASTSTAYLQFSNRDSGRCLNASSAAGANGTALQQATCTGGVSQRFLLQEYP